MKFHYLRVDFCVTNIYNFNLNTTKRLTKEISNHLNTSGGIEILKRQYMHEKQ